MKHWLLPLLFLLAVGCRSSDVEKAVNDASATEQPAAAAAKDPGTRDPTRSRIIWRWPDDAGEPRDLDQDHEECLQLADAQTTSIRRTGVLWDCMRRKGWHRVKGAELNLGGMRPEAAPK